MHPIAPDMFVHPWIKRQPKSNGRSKAFHRQEYTTSFTHVSDHSCFSFPLTFYTNVPFMYVQSWIAKATGSRVLRIYQTLIWFIPRSWYTWITSVIVPLPIIYVHGMWCFSLGNSIFSSSLRQTTCYKFSYTGSLTPFLTSAVSHCFI